MTKITFQFADNNYYLKQLVPSQRKFRGYLGNGGAERASFLFGEGSGGRAGVTTVCEQAF